MNNARSPVRSAIFLWENAMSDSHHDHHHEDPSVCYRVALVFLGVIAAIAILAVFN